MSYILNRIRLVRLKFREWMLLGQAEHAAALLAQHAGEYRFLMSELQRTRREIALRTAPEVLLSQALAARKS